MKFQELREEVCRVNCEISRTGLAMLTWGNASAVDREAGVMAIKPSGVDYAEMSAAHIVLLDLNDGSTVEGDLRPSSDSATHLELYRAFDELGGVIHTHSHYATVWAQAHRDIPCLGTTHADTFYGPVPTTRNLSEEEVNEAYERNTGRVIVDCIRERGIEPLAVPGILAAGHAPFTWGRTVAKALENALILEEVARMALHTQLLRADAPVLPDYQLDKHYLRKHGAGAYYGQK